MATLSFIFLLLLNPVTCQSVYEKIQNSSLEHIFAIMGPTLSHQYSYAIVQPYSSILTNFPLCQRYMTNVEGGKCCSSLANNFSTTAHLAVITDTKISADLQTALKGVDKDKWWLKFGLSCPLEAGCSQMTEFIWDNGDYWSNVPPSAELDDYTLSEQNQIALLINGSIIFNSDSSNAALCQFSGMFCQITDVSCMYKVIFKVSINSV